MVGVSEDVLSRTRKHLHLRAGGNLISVKPKPEFQAMKMNLFFAFCQFARMRRTILRTLALVITGVPALLQAQYSEIKMGEYLHYAVAAANGGVYAGIDGIGYTTVFGTPSLYKTNTGWLDLPVAQG